MKQVRLREQASVGITAGYSAEKLEVQSACPSSVLYVVSGAFENAVSLPHGPRYFYGDCTWRADLVEP